MKKIIFKGCGTALATPFTENGVNFEEFRKVNPKIGDLICRLGLEKIKKL